MWKRFLLAHRTNVSRGTTHARRGASRGQALVEFALLAITLMTLIVGATDISTLLDDHLNVVYAARAGARTASVIGSYSPTSAPYTADCAAIGAVQSALAGNRNIQVSQIAIYKSDANGQPVGGTSGTLLTGGSTGGLTGGSTGGITGTLAGSYEDIYPGNAVCNSNGTITPAAIQQTWPPSCRNNYPFQEDSVGVAITFSYTYQLNVIGLPAFGPVTDSAVMPIEVVTTPGAATSGTC